MAELTRRYIVMPLATEGPFDLQDPEGTFVLKPWKDPAALAALEAYRDRCYPELARELDAWIASIRSGPVLRGGVGARNERHAATPTPPVGRTGTARGSRRRGRSRARTPARPKKRAKRRS